MKTKILLIGLVTTLCSSCAVFKTTSVFARTEVIPGITKTAFIKRYGVPTTRNVVYDEQNVLNETLFYTETLFVGSHVITTTAFQFRDGKLISQEVIKTEQLQHATHCEK